MNLLFLWRKEKVTKRNMSDQKSRPATWSDGARVRARLTYLRRLRKLQRF